MMLMLFDSAHDGLFITSLLLQIRQQEQTARKAIVANPVKMDHIKAEVTFASSYIPCCSLQKLSTYQTVQEACLCLPLPYCLVTFTCACTQL